MPQTSKIKPGISNATKLSRPSARDIIQIKNVRDVSIVERYAAEAYLVVAIPVTLKPAIEHIVKIKSKITMPF